MALVSHMRYANVQAQPVEQVQAFRYLDIDLVFSQHTDTTYKKKANNVFTCSENFSGQQGRSDFGLPLPR